MKHLYINDVKVNGTSFVYDSCHKIYIIEDLEDVKSVYELWGEDTQFYRLEDLENIYDSACPLRFINNWKLDKEYVKQDENNVVFEWK